MRERERVKSDQGKLNNLGFTLIELLVVISIIGFLATAAMVAFNSARMKARDTKRKADLTQIRKALEMLYVDQGTYITTSEICGDYSTGCSSCGCGGETAHGYGSWSPTYSNLYRALVPQYMARLPVDPINNSTYFYYFEPNSDGQGSCTSASWSVSCEFRLCVTRLETTGGRWCNDSFGVGPR